MKGIILAGGSGTRLYPLTISTSKHLLPIYDKPMIYYPLSILMIAGIKEILIITAPEHYQSYINLLGDGNRYGLILEYIIQENPRGLADAFILGEEFINNEPVCLILGDNLIYGQSLQEILENASNLDIGALIFGYYVMNPKEFGVVEFDDEQKVLSLEEKPNIPKSNFAVPGLYFYDKNVCEYVKTIKPSSRGELEITDLNKVYLEKNLLKAEILGRGIAWFDTGSYSALLEASNFVSAIQKRQGLYIASIDEIAYRYGYITKSQLLNNSKLFNNNDYGNYLSTIAQMELLEKW